jgi:hypothetical protein
MSRTLPLLVALLLCVPAATMFAVPSHACSCAPPKDAATALAAAHTVFEGRVVQSNPEDAQAGGPPPLVPGPILHRFEVTRSWKGEPAELVTVRTPGSSASCGRSYDKGVGYILYASLEPDGLLRDTLCTRTRKASDGQEDIAILDGKTTAPATPAATSAEEQSPATTVPIPEALPADSEDDLSRAKPGCTVSGSSQAPDGPTTWWSCTLLLAVAMVRRTRD